MIGDFIGEVVFEIIIEPIGAFIRFVYLKFQGKKVTFKEILSSKNEEEETDNKIINRVAFLIFMFHLVLVIMIIYSLKK
ncbi:MAG: hypothetical protein ACPG4Y_00605 [Chitinophagales bacterium]